MTAPSSTPRRAAQDDDRDASAELRGRTTVGDRAVARITAQAVTEVEDAGGSAGRMLGVALGGDDLDNSAQVRAQVDGQTASLQVRLSVTYPASVAHTTERVRAHLLRRIRELTGLAVSRVDITVTALRSSRPQERRVR
jgi:uncharacterized alkaline shock family protein YloU